ncbi:MAG: hypothetical protein WBH00_23170 [Xanthobacteraceae bacterium]
MAETAQFDRAYSYCTIEILRDEDWNDQVVLRQLNADGSEVDLPFTNITRFDLYIRPRFDHNTLIRKLSSPLSEGHAIRFDTALPGEIQIFASRSSVIATLPVGEWDQFLVATYNDGSTSEFWRGPLKVHPGKVTS